MPSLLFLVSSLGKDWFKFLKNRILDFAAICMTFNFSLFYSCCWQSSVMVRDPGSGLGVALLCDLRQITVPLCASSIE